MNKGKIMTRDEHLTWCKQRAMEYVACGDLVNAVISMMSDLEKHPDTSAKGTTLAMLGLLAAQQAANADVRNVIRYIQGFN